MKIFKLRQQMGLSQKAFGKMFGIPLRTIQNWEGYEHGGDGLRSSVRKPPAFIYIMLGIIFFDKIDDLPEKSVEFLEKKFKGEVSEV